MRKLEDIDERLRHLDEDIAAAEKKGEEATHSHGLLGIGGINDG